MNKLPIEFTFAGFNFPRYIPELSNGKHRARSVYYHAPTPLTGGPHPGRGFYLADHGSPRRYDFADDIAGARIDHKGWYTDEYGDGDKMRGIIIRLPHGKMLAGWSMGEGMASSIEGHIYTDEIEAARAADQIAEYAAEEEREYQAAELERIEEEEHRLEECTGTDDEDEDRRPC